MKASRFTSRFKRSGEKPVETKAEPAVTPAAAESSAVAKPSEAVAEPVAESKAAPATEAVGAPAEQATTPPGAQKASRLVEAARPASRIDKAAIGRMLTSTRPLAKPVAAAAAIVLALGVGYGLGTTAGGEGSVAAAQLQATAADLRLAHAELVGLTAETKALRAAVDGSKGEREKTRSELLARQAQLADRLERSGQEHAARIGRLAETVERVEKAQRDPSRLQALTERLDRIEKGLSTGSLTVAAATPTPPPKPATGAKDLPAGPDVTQTGSLAEPAPAKVEIDPRKTKVEGYFIRDIDSGFALVETRGGRYVDVAVGYTVPGLGRVEAIERRGRQWVVVTPKGYIGER